MNDYPTVNFQSTSMMYTGYAGAGQALPQLQESGSTSLEYYRPAASVRMETSTNISEDWADDILVTLGMKEPDYVAARVPRPDGNTSIGELTPIGDCILPLLACLLVYIGVRVKRARANAQVKL